MTADFSSSSLSFAPLQVLAQAYGTDTYNSNSYNGSSVTEISPQTPVTGSVPQAPNTGFFAEPPIVTLPGLLVLAIIVGSISFSISRLVRRRRNK